MRWLHTTRGELLRRLARWEEARAAYTRAQQLAAIPAAAGEGR
jgi:predicted RNA polymerase sigma factor